MSVLKPTIPTSSFLYGRLIGYTFPIILCTTLICPGRAEMAAPAAAVQAGYSVRTFVSDSDFSELSIDQGLTFRPGFKWYNSNIVKSQDQSPTNNSFNNDGSITTFSPAYGLGLVSAANIDHSPGFVGTAFGGGGYFEAELKFDPERVDLKEGQWPAFWSVSVESSARLPGQQWKGQPVGYNHTVEFDVFEYLYPRSKPRNVYGASGHDFFGIYGVTCPRARCKVDSVANERIAPVGTDWRLFHKFGMLWVPASATKKGRVEFYFDGQPIGSRIEWERCADEEPPVTISNGRAFCEVDTQHLIMILGSGRSSPITVRSVVVWQASDKFNLRN